jgi:hypothetical protein
MLHKLDGLSGLPDTRGFTDCKSIRVARDDLFVHLIEIVLQFRTVETVREAKLIGCILIIDGYIVPGRTFGNTIDDIHTKTVTPLTHDVSFTKRLYFCSGREGGN